MTLKEVLIGLAGIVLQLTMAPNRRMRAVNSINGSGTNNVEPNVDAGLAAAVANLTAVQQQMQ